MIRINQIKMNLNHNDKDLEKEIVKKLKLKKTSESSKDLFDYEIVKKSIDARKKEDIKYIYAVNVKVKNIKEEEILKKVNDNNIMSIKPEKYVFKVKGTEKLSGKIVIIGSGPAGLFSAYMLTKYGYEVELFERGECIEKRDVTVDKFFCENILNEESNIQFGEGGAGTYSDGKLNTLVNDKAYRHKEVMKIFVENGADEEILYINKPHIGTDVLKNVIINMRKKIIKNGGIIHFDSKMTDILIEEGKVKAVEINNELIVNTNHLILALGHSARDTFYMLYKRNIKIEQKPLAIGVRIEHPQELINQSMYGEKFKDSLAAADYKLTAKINDRGVYSFCMCPGGYVVNASSEKNRLVVNGMSYHKRDGINANSALVVTINTKDYNDEHPLAGIEFQRQLENKAFSIGESYIPIQRLEDFLNDKKSINLGLVKPSIKGKYTFANLREILPDYVTNALIGAIAEFGKKIKGFDDKDAILSAIESRTSSPIRIIRDENFMSNIIGIYPAGEGAGYAGGITSAAIDGIKIFEEIATKYKN